MSLRPLACLWLLLAAALGAAPETPGLRVATAGHSFHVWMGPIVEELAKGAGIDGHRTVASSFIGGSRTSQHWDVPEERNKVKGVLSEGGADVLTLSPTLVPDDAILKFAQLGLAKNPALRSPSSRAGFPTTTSPSGSRASGPRPSTAMPRPRSSSAPRMRTISSWSTPRCAR